MELSKNSTVPEEQKQMFIAVKPVLVSLNANDYNLSNIQLNLMIEVSSLEPDNMNVVIRNQTEDNANEMFDDQSQLSALPELPSEDPLLFVPINGVKFLKPPFTYRVIIAALIEMSENKALNVAQIYRGFRDLFPYFFTAEMQWRNSIRHCLSFTKWFKKSDTHIMPNTRTKSTMKGDADVFTSIRNCSIALRPKEYN
ncbi:hypothetical protein B4U80_13895 [Leptotrombidium deliense]|uniref:Fork-head domain-containing protein n=1 Tax=Leptotrombidium deliense TaxID=299467 RepID=A0A443S8M1_9ACAR|nr:hypothetical protein B4U80_13895 [Leptotrombidium deliense]